MSDDRAAFDRFFSGEEAEVPAELVATPARDEVVDPQAQAAPEAPLPEPDATPAEAAPEPAPEAPPAPTAADRHDWKEKAIRLEEQLKAATAAIEASRAAPKPEPQQQQPATAVPDPVSDPAGFAEHQALLAFSARADMSEMLVRQQHADVDEKLAAFQAEAAKNPALAAELRNQKHPWKFVYDQGARALVQKEIGDDPAAYRARIEAEAVAKARAEWEAERAASAPAAPPPSAVNLPPSLSGARSAAPRGGPPVSVPTFDEFFGRPN